jgi:hypothetical protein
VDSTVKKKVTDCAWWRVAASATQLAIRPGELALAAIELRKALELARRLGNPPQLYRTLAAVGDLRRAQWDESAGRRTYRHALAVIDGVGAELADPSLRERFLSSSEIERIRELADLGTAGPPVKRQRSGDPFLRVSDRKISRKAS